MENVARIEILIVGDEILTGDITDTNSNWLCKMVHDRGGSVSRITVVPDMLEVVAREVKAAVERGIDILFTSGGLGPTCDDLTLQAVAAGTGRKCVLHAEALKMVRNQYDYFFSRGKISQKEMTPAREKMAHLPHGARPLFNSSGIAPGVFLRVNRTAIISVPGVPSELQDIINNPLKEFFNQVFGDGVAFSRRVGISCGGESLLEPLVSRLIRKYPEVYTKSLAAAIGQSPEVDILMSITGSGEKEALLDEAFEELCRNIRESGLSARVKKKE